MPVKTRVNYCDLDLNCDLASSERFNNIFSCASASSYEKVGRSKSGNSGYFMFLSPQEVRKIIKVIKKIFRMIYYSPSIALILVSNRVLRISILEGIGFSM